MLSVLVSFVVFEHCRFKIDFGLTLCCSAAISFQVLVSCPKATAYFVSLLLTMSKRLSVSATNGSDAYGAWQREMLCKRRKYAEEHIRRAGGSWMYSSDPNVDNTLHWITEGTFIECQSCGSLVQQSLKVHVVSKNDFMKTTESRTSCSRGVHNVPQPEEVPNVLRGVMRVMVPALRPVELHCVTTARAHRHGYGHSTKPVSLSWPLASVETRIDALEGNQRRKARRAFAYPLETENPRLSCFVVEHREWLTTGESRRYWSLNGLRQPFVLVGRICTGILQCAKGDWAEPPHDAAQVQSWFSSEGPLASFGLCCRLRVGTLVHDRWVYETITRAVNSTDFQSTLQALKAKPSMRTYMDRVKELCAILHRTLGPASLFLTIAPGKNISLYSRLVGQAMTQCSRHHRGLASLEVHHTVHVVMQVLKGFIAGVNVSKPVWKNFELSDKFDTQWLFAENFKQALEQGQKGKLWIIMEEEVSIGRS